MNGTVKTLKTTNDYDCAGPITPLTLVTNPASIFARIRSRLTFSVSEQQAYFWLIGEVRSERHGQQSGMAGWTDFPVGTLPEFTRTRAKLDSQNGEL